jgi:hypothetical protein
MTIGIPKLELWDEEKQRKLDKLKAHLDAVVGDSDDFISMDNSSTII